MGSGDLNAKKSWHVVNLKNQQKVWESERAALAERKKVAERVEELRKERQEEEIARQLEEAGGRKRVDRVDWMYQGPSAENGGMVTEEAEAFLLGKRRIDSLIRGDDHKKLEKNAAHDRFAGGPSAAATGPGAAAGAGGGMAAVSTARDTAAKIREDPLLAIRRQEQEAYEAMVNDPIRRRQLLASMGLAADEKKSSRSSSDRKRRRGDDDDRDGRHRHHSSRHHHRDRDRDRDRDDDDAERRHRRRQRDDSRDGPVGRQQQRRRSRSPARRHDAREDRRDSRRDRSGSRGRADYDRPSRNGSSREERRGGDRDRRGGQERDTRDSQERDRRDGQERDRRDGQERDRRDDRPAYRDSVHRDKGYGRNGGSGSADGDGDERARKLAAMQAAASDLDQQRERRLAEREAQEAAARAADDKARARDERLGGGQTAFATSLRQQVGEMGLAERLGRGRKGLQRDEE